MHVVDAKIGSEGSVTVDFVAGNLMLEVDEATAGLTGGLKVTIPVTYFVDALASKLGQPGQVVGSIIDGLLKGVA